ncbi:hypothetical protein M885DRAFT_507175 [Pelagophyceae sp. CCMP2097]|nr:hypothetical protein M885DRAFT_507175 [Pelagophyceae sp. CCMP2097]
MVQNEEGEASDDDDARYFSCAPETAALVGGALGLAPGFVGCVVCVALRCANHGGRGDVVWQQVGSFCAGGKASYYEMEESEPTAPAAGALRRFPKPTPQAGVPSLGTESLGTRRNIFPSPRRLVADVKDALSARATAPASLAEMERLLRGWQQDVHATRWTRAVSRARAEWPNDDEEDMYVRESRVRPFEYSGPGGGGGGGGCVVA